ncbi:MAG: ThuA domain-containing protein [Oscillospiraceae bacterium]|nr:ThuA domain-containing protein [Oscillospiraceae bacterium]
MRVTIWNEYLADRGKHSAAGKLYPGGMHEHLKRALAADDLDIRTAWLGKGPDHGLSRAALRDTDVLLWWGHSLHGMVPDKIARRVAARVHEGMGFIPLHSSHMAKPFRLLMGTPCTLRWRESGDRCVLWNVSPNHPITRGVPLHFTLEKEETYGETFAIPQPEELIFISWFDGGNVFRGGCTFTRGAGRIFYFHPGHETFPTYHDENVLRVLSNAIRWAAPSEPRDFRPNEIIKPVVGK